MSRVPEINWDAAAKIAIKLALLSTKYREMSRAELMGLINAVESHSEPALLEHLYNVLRSIDAAEKAREDQEVAEVLRMVREELWR